MLNKEANEISLYEIITAVEENIDQTLCGGSLNCQKDKPCSLTMCGQDSIRLFLII